MPGPACRRTDACRDAIAPDTGNDGCDHRRSWGVGTVIPPAVTRRHPPSRGHPPSPAPVVAVSGAGAIRDANCPCTIKKPFLWWPRDAGPARNAGPGIRARCGSRAARMPPLRRRGRRRAAGAGRAGPGAADHADAEDAPALAAVATAEESADRRQRLDMVAADLGRRQERNGEEDAGDAPEPPAEREGEEDRDRVEREASTHDERGHDVPLH